jgi:hypothetical protein
VSRSGDERWSVIVTGRAFVILPPFCSPGCPLVIDELDDTAAEVRRHARTATLEGIYPRCGGTSRRVHAWHTRRLADLPVAGRRVTLELHVRRLICPNAGCSQRTMMSLPLPPTPTPTPRVLSVDDVALRLGHHYATVPIDAVNSVAQPPRGRCYPATGTRLNRRRDKRRTLSGARTRHGT